MLACIYEQTEMQSTNQDQLPIHLLSNKYYLRCPYDYITRTCHKVFIAKQPEKKLHQAAEIHTHNKDSARMGVASTHVAASQTSKNHHPFSYSPKAPYSAVVAAGLAVCIEKGFSVVLVCALYRLL